jgi:hypothetical protein
MIDLEVGLAKESLDGVDFCLLAGQHQQTHLHSVNGVFTWILRVIHICSLPIFIPIEIYSSSS